MTTSITPDTVDNSRSTATETAEAEPGRVDGRTWRPAECFELDATLTASATTAIVAGVLSNHCVPRRTTLQVMAGRDAVSERRPIPLHGGADAFSFEVPLPRRPEDVTVTASAAGAMVTFAIERRLGSTPDGRQVFGFRRMGRAGVATTPPRRSRQGLWGVLAAAVALVVALGGWAATEVQRPAPSKPVAAASTTPVPTTTTSLGGGSSTTVAPVDALWTPPAAAPKPTATSLILIGTGPVGRDELVSLHATVATQGSEPLSPTVDFLADGFLIGTGSWDGWEYALTVRTGQPGLTVGVHQLTARYDGDQVNQPSTSGAVALDVVTP
jgi:hypothetical protein